VLSNKIRRSIKKNVGLEKPTVWVGKEGSTDDIVNEINRQLEQHGAVKAKVLQTALKSEEMKNLATKIANETCATLIEVRGHTFILHKPRKKAAKPGKKAK
jgi:RNA-binding protein